MMISASDILQSAVTLLVGLLIFLTLGHRFNLIEYVLIPAQGGSKLKKRIQVGVGLLIAIFSFLAVSIILSLFNVTLEIAKGFLILAVILLILRIALNDTFLGKDSNRINPAA
jgi:hypothetical protein